MSGALYQKEVKPTEYFVSANIYRNGERVAHSLFDLKTIRFFRRSGMEKKNLDKILADAHEWADEIMQIMMTHEASNGKPIKVSDTIDGRYLKGAALQEGKGNG